MRLFQIYIIPKYEVNQGWLREAVDDPDDVFKRIILFPLLECEIQHKVVILMVDGLDLDLIPPHAAASGEPSKSIPELLSRHAHLFPRWLLPVFTTRQSTAITAHFPGFRRISIDDLRKTQVGLTKKFRKNHNFIFPGYSRHPTIHPSQTSK